jgi:hypothetical protein
MVLKNLTPEGGKVLKKSLGKGPYVLRTDSDEDGRQPTKVASLGESRNVGGGSR